MSALLAPSDRGLLVVLVGASGTGKDSLLSAARQRFGGLDDWCFVRRVITRQGNDVNEPHRGVDAATFEAMRAAGEFIVHWYAHGLHYGIPISVIDELRQGRLVVLNGSRAALPDIRACFPRRRVVHVVVSDAVRERRLALRGRESNQDLAGRMARQIDSVVFERESVWELDNGGELALSRRRFEQRLLLWQQTLGAAESVD